MNKIFLLMLSTAFIFLVWINIEQAKGADNHNSQLMQLEQRNRVIQRGEHYYE